MTFPLYSQSKAIFKTKHFKGLRVGSDGFLCEILSANSPHIITVTAGLHSDSLVSSSSHAYKIPGGLWSREGSLRLIEHRRQAEREASWLVVSSAFGGGDTVMWLICAASQRPEGN